MQESTVDPCTAEAREANTATRRGTYQLSPEWAHAWTVVRKNDERTMCPLSSSVYGQAHCSDQSSSTLLATQDQAQESSTGESASSASSRAIPWKLQQLVSAARRSWGRRARHSVPWRDQLHQAEFTPKRVVSQKHKPYCRLSGRVPRLQVGHRSYDSRRWDAPCHDLHEGSQPRRLHKIS